MYKTLYKTLFLLLMISSVACAQSGSIVKVQDQNGLWTGLMNATALSANQRVYIPKNVDGKTFVLVAANSQTQTFNTGDIPFADATNPNFLTRRAIGSTGDVLTVAGGVPTWAPVPPGTIDTNYVYSQPNGPGDDPHNMIQSQTDYPDLLLQQHTGTSALLMWRDITGLSEHPMIDNSGNWDLDHVTNTLAVANGGTGQVTESAAFNALAPTTTDGDMIYHNSTGNVRLGAGSAYYPLVIDHVSGRPSWQQLRLDQAVQNVLPEANGGTNQNSYTTGDILFASATDILSKRAIGSTGDVLTVAGGVPTWAPASAGMTNPMTTLGDIIYEDATPIPARLVGNTSSTKNFLTQTGTGTISAVPSWGTIATGDIPDLGSLYIKNQYTTQSSAGFNITGSTNTVEAQIATTYTAGSATALKAVSNNTNGGHANYGLAFDVAGGGSNFDLIGSSSTWSMTNAGVLALGSALTVANGGTGAATLAANNVLLGNGTSALQTVAPSTSGNVLTSNGTTWSSTAPAASFTVAQTVTINNIQTTSTDGIVIQNTTAATNTQEQWSPRLRVDGLTWTNGNTTSNALSAVMEVRGRRSTSSTPEGELAFSMNGAGTTSLDTVLTLWRDLNSQPVLTFGGATKSGAIFKGGFDRTTSGAGGDFTIFGQSANGSNQFAGNLVLKVGAPTGNKLGQAISFQSFGTGSSGSSVNTSPIVLAKFAPINTTTAKLTFGASSSVTGVLNVCQSAAANASCGTGTLASGTVTISTTAVATGDLIFLTDVTGGTNIGTISAGTIVNGTSFVVTSTNILDNSSFVWLIVRPN